MHARSAVVMWGMTAYHSLAGHIDDGDNHSDTVDDTSKALVEGTLAIGFEGDRQVASCQLSLRRRVIVASYHQRHGGFRSHRLEIEACQRPDSPVHIPLRGSHCWALPELGNRHAAKRLDYIGIPQKC